MSPTAPLRGRLPLPPKEGRCDAGRLTPDWDWAPIVHVDDETVLANHSCYICSGNAHGTGARCEEDGWPGALLATCAPGTYHVLMVAVPRLLLENRASYLLLSDVTQRGGLGGCGHTKYGS